MKGFLVIVSSLAPALSCNRQPFQVALLLRLCGHIVMCGEIVERGTNSALVRARICAGLEFLGIALDADRNQRHAPLISRAFFTKDKPIIFAFHGYPWLIHRLTYRRTNHKNLHV